MFGLAATAAAGAAGALAGAASAVWAADAFLTSLLGADNIPRSAAQNDSQNHDQDHIFHRHTLFPAAERIFSL